MANNAETRVQVIIDKLSLLLASGSFAHMNSIDRKLLLQYLTELKDSVQLLVDSPEPTAPRVESTDAMTVQPETRSPESGKQPPPSREDLSDEVLRELKEVQKHREEYERAASAEANRKKSINTVAQEKRAKTSLHERFEDKADAPLADQLKNKPMSSLRTGISLNDKIWFVRELFAGNNEAYDTAVRKLDSAGSLPSALHVFDELVTAHKWPTDKLSVRKFSGFITRRFAGT